MLQFVWWILRRRSPPSLLGKPKNPREVWIFWHNCSALRHRDTKRKECSWKVGKAEDHPSKTSVPQPSISASASAPPFIPPCISPALCMGGEALAGCQSACGGVNGQPSAQNTLWMSDTPRCTNERLQARLVRLNRELFPSHCVNVTCYFFVFFCIALRLSCMQSTSQPGTRRLWPFSGLWLYWRMSFQDLFAGLNGLSNICAFFFTKKNHNNKNRSHSVHLRLYMSICLDKSLGLDQDPAKLWPACAYPVWASVVLFFTVTVATLLCSPLAGSVWAEQLRRSAHVAAWKRAGTFSLCLFPAFTLASLPVVPLCYLTWRQTHAHPGGSALTFLS